jgi:hypothetical protein
MKNLFSLTICVMALLFVGCEPDVPATSSQVITGAASKITAVSAILHGKVNVDMSQYDNIRFGMMVSENKYDLNAFDGEMYEVKVRNGLDFELTLEGLSSNTKYYYCAWVILNNTQYELGVIKSFWTKSNAFSVSYDKKVTFSPGNLQYTHSTDTWSFAENQWDYIGTDNVKGGTVESDPVYGYEKGGSSLADKIDLFGESFVDWGNNKIGNSAPNTWRTLTYEEWVYLFARRPDAELLRGVASVNGVNGLILLPDTWVCPSGVTFKYGFGRYYGVEEYGQYQTFTAAQWSMLEAAGAVFLPASGVRTSLYVNKVQSDGAYWAASAPASASNAHCSYFTSSGCSYEVLPGATVHGYGRSVRLVKDL